MPYTWVVLPIQLLHGITFGLYWTVGVGYAAESAPKGLDATLQGAFAALISAAQIAALSVAGPLLDAYGGASLYRGCAGVAALVGLLPAALLGMERCRRRTRVAGQVARVTGGMVGSATAAQSAGVVLSGFDDALPAGDEAEGGKEDDDSRLVSDGSPPLVLPGALTSTGERK